MGRSPSKKRSKLTLSKYIESVNIPTSTRHTNNNVSNSASVLNVRVPSNSSGRRVNEQVTSTSIYYKVRNVLQGVDMSSFRSNDM